VNPSEAAMAMRLDVFVSSPNIRFPRPDAK
jgi:hypothetical protein